MNDRILRVSPEDAKNLKWLMRARAKDDARPGLTCIHRYGNRYVCVDGFRIHSIPVPQTLLNDETKRIEPLMNMAKLDSDTVLFPVTDSYASTSPEPSGMNKNVPDGMTQVAVFAINPKYLIDALTDMGTMVVIRVFGEKRQVVIESNFGQRLAVIMPMAIPDEYLKPHPIKLIDVPEEITKEVI